MSWSVKNASDAAKRRAYLTRMSGTARTSDGIKAAFHMDRSDHDALMERFPELDNTRNDPQACLKAWKKWAKSSASEPYRLNTKL